MKKTQEQKENSKKNRRTGMVMLFLSGLFCIHPYMVFFVYNAADVKGDAGGGYHFGGVLLGHAIGAELAFAALCFGFGLWLIFRSFKKNEP